MDTTELSLATLELSKLESCVELMLLAAYADGAVGPPERAAFEEHVAQATLGQLRPEIVQQVLVHFEAEAKKADAAARVQVIASRLQDARMRRAMLWLAGKVAAADGPLTGEELSFLRLAGAAFEIPPDELETLVGKL